MKLPPNILTAVLASAIMAVAVSPGIDGDAPRTDTADVPVIRVIIDHENHLALVPEGTVLPQGIRIFSSIEADPNAPDTDLLPRSHERPLVFSYAPVERFSHLSTTPNVLATVDSLPISDPDSSPTANGINSNQPCPSTIEVDMGGGVIHLVTCAFLVDRSGHELQQVSAYLSYPVPAVRARLLWVVHYVDHDKTDDAGTCYFWIGECASTYGFCTYFDQGVLTLDSKAAVRLPGPCTGDPLSCPNYSNTVSFAIVQP